MESTINRQATGLLVFYNEEMNVNIRSKVIGNEPWFVAKDVCNALDITNSRDAIKKMLDDDERGVANFYTPAGNYQGGGEQQLNIINESGMYNLIFRSRKPEARAFRKWVTNVVLPSIRRTGTYSASGIQSSEKESARLPLPKHRPFFENWKGCVEPHLSSLEALAVAKMLDVTYSHVRKVLMGTSVSERVARALTEKAMENKRAGVKYEPAVPVYEQLSIEWEKKETEELDVYFINGTDKKKRTVTVSRTKTANPKEVFVEITNENRGKVTFQ